MRSSAPRVAIDWVANAPDGYRPMTANSGVADRQQAGDDVAEPAAIEAPAKL